MMHVRPVIDTAKQTCRAYEDRKTCLDEENGNDDGNLDGDLLATERLWPSI
jgi:hypothetical protein